MKRILITVLAITMVLTCFIPKNSSYGADNIDSGALEAFLGELSGVNSETRKTAATLLRVYMKDETNGIKDLKRDLDLFLNDSHIKKIEDKGYSIEDIKNELDKLEGWNIENRLQLVNYLEAGDGKGIKDLISNKTLTPPISGGGGGSTNPTKENKEKTEEKTVEEKLLEVNFKDIENHKNREDIVFLAERAIIEGKTKESFDPDGELTRAEFMTLIYRVLGLESDKNKILPFKDVKSNSWYYEYVKAAYENHIVEGTSSTTFKPNDKVTREQMVTIIMRILNSKELTHTLEATDKDLAMFTDSNQASSYAKEYLFYGVKYGIIDGRTDTRLNPKENALRGEAANIVKKLYDILNK